jgi:trypsin
VSNFRRNFKSQNLTSSYFLKGVQNTKNGDIHTADRFFIRTGSTYKQSGGSVYNGTRIFVHPKFQAGANRRHHDIGIIQLKNEITLSSVSQLTKLIHDGSHVKVGDDGIVSGWGVNPDVPHDDHLNQVHLTVINSTICSKQIGEDTPEGMEQHEICGEAPGKAFCQGDSGGPFISTRTKEQIGIVSYGSNPCNQENKPSVFTSVKDNMDFIKHVIKKTRKSRQ